MDMLAKRWFKALFWEEKKKKNNNTDWNLCSSVQDIELLKIEFKGEILSNSPVSPCKGLAPKHHLQQGCTAAVRVENGFWPMDPWYLGRITPGKSGSTDFSCRPAHEGENLH